MTYESQLLNPLSSQLPKTFSEPTLVSVIIERIRAGVSLEEAKEYYRFLREVQADEARIAAAADFVKLQAELPAIPKLGQAHNYKYARWEDINERIKPILTKHGFALNFSITDETETGLAIIAILRHRLGHEERTSKRLPLDKSGSKNIVQQFGSTQSYAQRYAAIALLNLVSHGEDTDAADAADTFFVDAAQIAELRKLIERSGRTEELFCKKFMAEKIELLPASKYETATTFLQDIIKREQL